MSPATLRARAAAYFVAPRTPAPPHGDLIPLVHREPPPRSREDPHGAPAGHGAPTGHGAPARRTASPGRFVAPAPPSRVASAPVVPTVSTAGATTRFAPRAAVLGPAAGAVPAAAALACALRAAHGGPAAAVATWTPGELPRVPALRGPGTPAAARVAGRLAARGLPATAHGRVAWLPLDDHVLAATVAARRAAAALDVPFVIALAGPRCEIVEALLDEQDLLLVVAADPDGPLARLAVAGCVREAAACAPLRGVRRALALAGLAGAGALPHELGLDLARGRR